MNNETIDLKSTLERYKQALTRYKDDIELNNNKYNTLQANKNEIMETEKSLGCNLPNELKEYYLNCANGTENDIKEYGSSEDSFDVFSHQKIFGIVDYSNYYWNLMGIDESAFEYDTSVLAPLSDKEKLSLEKNNKEFFVCIVDWNENFLETFVFDKEHNFYRFYFYQDVTIGDYIDRLLNGRITKNKTLSKLVDGYLQEKIQELKDEFGY